eukprot:gene21841-biopygen30545
MTEAPSQGTAGSPEALCNSLSQMLLAPSTTELLDLPTPILGGILDILLIQNLCYTRGDKMTKHDQLLSLRLACSLFNDLVLARTTKMAFNGSSSEFSSLPVGLLQNLPNLQVLDLTQCKKSPLSLVGLPTTITELHLWGTAANQNTDGYPLLDLSPLSKCTGLRNLGISESNKRVADLSPLAACQCLERLNVRMCVALTSLSPPAHCTNLRHLSLSQTKITDLLPLSSCKELMSINCSKSEVSNLSPLSVCVKLENFDCSQTEVSDISPLSACLRLNYVNCEETSVRDISSLAGCPQLREIKCDKDVIGLFMRIVFSDGAEDYVVPQWYHPAFPEVDIEFFQPDDDEY